MQISAIVPILLNMLLREQQHQKQAPREQQAAFKEVMQAQPAQASPAVTEKGNAALQHRAAESSEPVLAPLPLRSPLFPDAQFFVLRRREEKKEKDRASGKEPTGIAFSLGTVNLGRLFFILLRKEENVSITCHVQNSTASALLNSRAEELTQKVREIGFEQVSFNCTILDPHLVMPATGFSSPGLLDLKV